MGARDLFGVALRILGVWFLSQAGYNLVLLTGKLQGFWPTSTTEPGLYKVFIAFYLVAAFILLVLADQIVKMVYGPAGDNKEKPPSE